MDERITPSVANFRKNIAWLIDHHAANGKSMRTISVEAGLANNYIGRIRDDPDRPQYKKPIIPRLDYASQLCRSMGFDLRHATVEHREFLRRIRKKNCLTSSDPVHNFRRNLDWLIKHDGRSLRKIGNTSGVAFPYLSRIRTGSNIPCQGAPMIPTLSLADRMGMIFNVPLHDMLLDHSALVRKMSGNNL